MALPPIVIEPVPPANEAPVAAYFGMFLVASVYYSQKHGGIRILDWKPLMFLGEISYSTYLWHYLLLSYLGLVFSRFQVRRLAPGEIWSALFPDESPATVDTLKERFSAFLDAQVSGVVPDQVRLLPERSHEA